MRQTHPKGVRYTDDTIDWLAYRELMRQVGQEQVARNEAVKQRLKQESGSDIVPETGLPGQAGLTPRHTNEKAAPNE